MIADEEQIRSLAAALAAAWSRCDAAGFANSFSADADFTSVRRERRHGRAEIAASHQSLFETVYRGTRLHTEVERIRPLRPGVAAIGIDSALYLADGSPVTGLGGPQGNTMHALAVVENRSGTWQIVAFHNMVPLPHRGG